MKNIILVISVILFCRCSNGPMTPEETIKEYTKLISNGECGDAKDFCIDEAKLMLDALIETGCDPYITTVDSVTCEIEEDKAHCLCHETRKQGGKISFPYELRKDKGEWKILENSKLLPDIE